MCRRDRGIRRRTVLGGLTVIHSPVVVAPILPQDYSYVVPNGLELGGLHCCGTVFFDVVLAVGLLIALLIEKAYHGSRDEGDVVPMLFDDNLGGPLDELWDL